VSDRALRSEYEALQVRQRRACEMLAVSDAAVHVEAEQLSREVASLERALVEREARAARRLARRPVSQRVAAFGFHLLFVAPVVAMVGVALGRRTHDQRAVAGLLLACGLALTLAWAVGPLRTALLRRFSSPWRLVRRVRRAVQGVEKTLPR
jgi:hypothetical protein